MTSDKKWIYQDNQECLAQWLNPDEAKHATAFPKTDVAPKKDHGGSWGSHVGLIYYSF